MKDRPNPLGEYDRGMLRSAFVSLFWNVIAYKKARGRYPLKRFSDEIGVNKSTPSRWFSGDRPNWQVNTIADIARALDVEIEIRAKDRQTGVIFAPHGIVFVVPETKVTVQPVDTRRAEVSPGAMSQPRQPPLFMAAA
jgi:hypothetical protein